MSDHRVGPVPATIRVADGPDAGRPAGLQSPGDYPLAATCWKCREPIRRESPAVPWEHSAGFSFPRPA